MAGVMNGSGANGGRLNAGRGRWWVVIVLWLLVLVSALAVVRTSHQARVKLNQLEVLKRHAGQLHVQWGQYLLEQSAWSAYGRIEKEATQKLRMAAPKQEQLIMVSE